MYDLLIKNGLVVDGTGSVAEHRDIAVRDGTIVEMAPVISGDARRTIDAAGRIVTPGFIDLHTHFDGQATWDDQLLPSSGHGVTTVVLGNCGIGFAPVRPGTEDWLISLTEGVEDIPGSALHEGIQWDWESFPEYLDVLARRHYAVDIATQVPHSAVRAYVLGRRAENDTEATDAELMDITRIVFDGIRAGAVGVGTSRVSVHRGSDGAPLPGNRAPETELMAIARAIRDAGGGVFQMVPSGGAGGVEGEEGEALRVGVPRDLHRLSVEVEMMRRIHRETGVPITFTLTENRGLGPEEFARTRMVVEHAKAAGEQVHPQFAPRPMGGLVSLGTYHPFRRRPSYLELADLPLAERARRMSDPAVKARILAEEDKPVDSADPRQNTHLTLQRHTRDIYPLLDADGRPDYEPHRWSSVAALAEARGIEPLEAFYDLLIEDGGEALLAWFATGYVHGDLDRVAEYLCDRQYLMGLGDAGAHVQFICDGSFPTFLLSHFGLRRTRGPRFAIESLVRKLTMDPAELYGFDDRGVLQVGRRADINVIDLELLDLRPPRTVDDLPTGAKRFIQDASGYVATVVNGIVTRQDDQDTGERPGRLYRRDHAAAKGAGHEDG